MIVVEEWPDVRNSDPLDDALVDKVLASGVKEPAAYTNLATKIKTWQPTATDPIPPFRPSDPDFDAAFDASFLPKQKGTKNIFEVSYPYIEREFYFTTDKSPIVAESSAKSADWNYAADKFKLRIPNRAVQIKYASASWGAADRGQTQKFIALQLETASPNQPAIAPILPGRYGVIGTAGVSPILILLFKSTGIRWAEISWWARITRWITNIIPTRYGGSRCVPTPIRMFRN